MKLSAIPFMLMLSSVLSCAQKNAEMSVADIADEESKSILAKQAAPATSQLAQTPRTDLYSNGKNIIKTANYRFQVDNVKQSTAAIEASIRKYPAYISTSNLNLENPILENKITIRVQQEYFQDLLSEIDRQAVFVNFRNVTTSDVSKEFVDLESRLRTKREVEQRYIDILRKKAGTIEELLQAEQQIGALHEEIEATISRINYLKDEVSYSTINLEFYQTIVQEVTAGTEDSFSQKISEAFSVGWEAIRVVAVGLVYIWPLFLLAAVALLILKWRKPVFAKVSGKSVE
jgi:hypothetical protein